ncbi:MAG: hypothetical protein ACTJGT_04645 [Microbacteriaceae bacterium]
MCKAINRIAAATLYDDAAMPGSMTFHGRVVLDELTRAVSRGGIELNTTDHTVVQPGRLAREAGAPRAFILRGLRELQASGVLDVNIVTGEKAKMHTFAVRLWSPREVLANAIVKVGA